MLQGKCPFQFLNSGIYLYVMNVIRIATTNDSPLLLPVQLRFGNSSKSILALSPCPSSTDMEMFSFSFFSEKVQQSLGKPTAGNRAARKSKSESNDAMFS